MNIGQNTENMESDSSNSTPTASVTDIIRNAISTFESEKEDDSQIIEKLLQRLHATAMEQQESEKQFDEKVKKAGQKEQKVTNDRLIKEKVEKKLPNLKQRCYITDNTPHIAQTDMGYHVLIHRNEDHSLFIYKPNCEIIRTPPWYKRSTLDINQILSEQWSYSRNYSNCRSHLKILPQKERDDLRKQIGELMENLPEEKSTLQTGILSDETEFVFTNFSFPTKQTLECWFHPTNIWIECHPDVYKCYGYDDKFQLTGKYTGNRPVLVTTPMEIFSDQKTNSKIGYDVTLDRKPSYKEVIRLITIFETAKNNPRFRCRLDIEDRDSQFWMEKPLMKRIYDVAKYPNDKITLENGQLIDLSQLIESQAQHTKIKYNKIYNGLSLLDNILDQEQNKIEITSKLLSTLTWTELDDKNSRSRGYYYVSSFDKYTIYKNIFRFDLYTIRSDECNFEYHVFHNGTTPVSCVPNYDPIETENKPLVQQVFPKIKLFDITPKTLYADSFDEWTELDDVDTEKEEGTYLWSKNKNDWVPATIQCCSSCTIPFCAFHEFDRMSKRFRRMRKLEIPNKILDKCVWSQIELDTYDHQHFDGHYDGEWKTTELDKIPIYKCFNPKPKHSCHEDELGSDITTVITYSKYRGLCGLDPNHFELSDELTQQNDRENPTVWTPPATPCEPGCHIPTEILDIKVAFSDDLAKWYKSYALNQHILNHKLWQITHFPCTLTYTHSWEMITFQNRPVYRCQSSRFTTPMSIPITSDRRWELAYCFPEEQFRQIKWRQNPTMEGYTHRIYKARITIPTLDSNYYTVRLDNGQFCSYSFNMNRMGTPDSYPSRLKTPEHKPFDEDMTTHNILRRSNFKISEDYLKKQTHFNKQDETVDYSTSMKIIQNLKLDQHMNPNTKMIISSIPTVAIPIIRHRKIDEDVPPPDLKVGADSTRPKKRNTRKGRRKNNSPNSSNGI